jgi:hypothetical protein
MSTLVQGRIGIALRLGGAVDGAQAVQLSASSRELLAQFGHLVLQPALGGHQFGAALADDGAASEAREQQRVAAKAELAAERRRVNVDEIEGIIRDAILREREFYSEVVAHVLGEALGRLDQEIKEKRDALASDLRELRRDIAGVNSVLAEVRAADREPERVVDLPNPIGRRVN